MSSYVGRHHSFINVDLLHMETARSQIEAVIGAITALKERAILNETKDAMDDLINGLTDCKSDLSHIVTCAEDAVTMKAAE